jgi:transposase
MSTSLLYHGFGIRGYRYVRTEYVEGGIVFTIAQDQKMCRCPACGGRNIILKGGVTRRFRGGTKKGERKKGSGVFVVDRTEGTW